VGHPGTRTPPLTHTTRRLIEYYSEVGPGDQPRYLLDDVQVK